MNINRRKIVRGRIYGKLNNKSLLIFYIVAQHPGIGSGEISRLMEGLGTKLRNKDVNAYANILIRNGLIEKRLAGRRNLFYTAGGVYGRKDKDL